MGGVHLKYKGITIREDFVKEISESFNTPERIKKILHFELEVSQYLEKNTVEGEKKQRDKKKGKI